MVRSYVATVTVSVCLINSIIVTIHTSNDYHLFLGDIGDAISKKSSIKMIIQYFFDLSLNFTSFFCFQKSIFYSFLVPVFCIICKIFYFSEVTFLLPL